LQIDSIDNDGVFKTTQYSGSLPALGSGSLGGAFTGGVADTNRQGLYFENITTSNNQGFDPASDYSAALNLLNNKDEFDFNLLFVPGAIMNSNAISVCENRGDAFAVVDPVVFGAATQNVINASAGSTSNYAAAYWPWVQTFSTTLGKAVWVPASVVMAGVYAFNDEVGAEWFAPAGLNRGGIGSVIRAERKLSSTNRDDLYSANINPLATFPGEGVVAYGQKTFQKRATSLDRINVRRLLINLKRFVANISRQLVFEQNTAVTRNRFLSSVNPYMEQVVQKQGLYAYKVVMDDSNNTADVIDRNQLIGQIYVQPTKTAEFIILDFTLQPTGATFPA
jgi:phage tail sheath protein FI